MQWLLFGNFTKDWATFNFNIWSRWSRFRQNFQLENLLPTLNVLYKNGQNLNRTFKTIEWLGYLRSK